MESNEVKHVGDESSSHAAYVEVNDVNVPQNLTLRQDRIND